MPHHRILFPLALLCSLLFSSPCQAGGLSVSPLRLNVGAERSIGSVTLTNTSGETLVVEAEAEPWPADAEGQSSRDLVLNPPVSTLAPGERVTVRVGLVKRLANDVERAYRLYFTELPTPRAPDATGIGVRLRLGIPVFVAAASAQPQPLQWSAGRDADGVVLTAQNPGNVHQRVGRVVVDGRAATQASPYVLPGRTAAFRVPGLAAAPAGSRVTLQVQADDATRQVELQLP